MKIIQKQRRKAIYSSFLSKCQMVFFLLIISMITLMYEYIELDKWWQVIKWHYYWNDIWPGGPRCWIMTCDNNYFFVCSLVGLKKNQRMTMQEVSLSREARSKCMTIQAWSWRWSSRSHPHLLMVLPPWTSARHGQVWLVVAGVVWLIFTSAVWLGHF